MLKNFLNDLLDFLKGHPYKIGENYFLRTITCHYTGKLSAVYKNEIVLEDAAWIPNDGRFMQAVATGNFSEIEPFPDGPVIIGRGTILDMKDVTWPLPRIQV